jgi:SPP1 gp7 family putative phage head morphogenesis protein
MGTGGSSSKQAGNLFDSIYGEVQANLFNTFFSAEEKLLYMYHEAYNTIVSDIAGLYERYSVNGKLTYAEMSKFNRLKNLERQVSDKLLPQFRKSDEYIKKITGIIYEESFYQHAYAIDQDAGAALKWGLLREADVESIVNSPLSKLADSKALMGDRVNAVFKIRKAVTLGLVRGEGYREMAKRIQDVIGIQPAANGTMKATGKGLLYKSTMIVRTEGQRAVVEGQQKAYTKAEEEGIDLVQVWDAALDSRTRPEHGALDGKKKQEKGWKVPGIGWVTAPLQSGVASFDIHCRCRIRGQIKGYPPHIRGKKGTGQTPWMDYETWKQGVKAKGSAKSIQLKKVAPLPPPKISEIPSGSDGAKAFGSRLEKIDKQVGGSTGAQVFRDDEGQEWIVKSYKGKTEQVRNEFVANQLYREVGISVPEARLAQVGENLCIASKRLESGYETVGWKHIEFVKDAAKTKRGFVMDAYLGNWDVAGLDIDNLMWKDGKISTITRIDQGGTLLYRAQGGLKGKAFGSTVDELQSLRNPGVNKASASLFKNVTDSDIAGQIVTLKNRLNDDKILAILKSSGMDNAAVEQYHTLLRARLKYLKDWEREFRKQGKPKVAPVAKPPVNVISDPYELRVAAIKTYDAKFTAAEQKWMKRYTGSGYTTINEKALKGSFTKELDSGIDKLPRYDGYVGRGIANIDDIQENFAKWKSGEWAYVDWKAYSSTTITPGKSFDSHNGYLAVVRTKGVNKAGYINGRSSIPSEDEYLFAPGAKFRVAGWAESPNKRYRTLLLEEVDYDIPKQQAPPKEMKYEEIMELWKKDLREKGNN